MKFAVHPEEDWLAQVPVGGDAKRNLVASEISGDGDVDAVLADCDEVLEDMRTICVPLIRR